jgi:tetratricopeptide (TPR) repeat protein
MALGLDPLSPTISVWAGVILHTVDPSSEGLSTIERQVAMTPQLWMPRYFRSLALATSGRYEEAKSDAEAACELSNDGSLTLFQHAAVCYRLGERALGEEQFGRLQQRARAGYVAPMFLAWLHLHRGEEDAALCRAAEALAAMDPWAGFHHLFTPNLVPTNAAFEKALGDAIPQAAR